MIGGKPIGPGFPALIIAEAGINHNGDLATALELVRLASRCGCDAIKFQKRSPELCVPEAQKSKIRDTPWGEMTYLEYKQRIEFGEIEYDAISAEASKHGLQWFASPWDIPSLEFLVSKGVPAVKIASASITDLDLVTSVAECDLPVILSTGMSELDEIDKAVDVLAQTDLIILHSTSTYPCPPEESNLRMIETLRNRYGRIIGYSGHESGLQISLAALSLGACVIERHFTLNRAMWGTDQAASLGPRGLEMLVRDIRVIEAAMGDGIKRITSGELEPRRRLRGE